MRICIRDEEEQRMVSRKNRNRKNMRGGETKSADNTPPISVKQTQLTAEQLLEDAGVIQQKAEKLLNQANEDNLSTSAKVPAGAVSVADGADAAKLESVADGALESVADGADAAKLESVADGADAAKPVANTESETAKKELEDAQAALKAATEAEPPDETAITAAEKRVTAAEERVKSLTPAGGRRRSRRRNNKKSAKKSAKRTSRKSAKKGGKKHRKSAKKGAKKRSYRKH